MKRYKYDLPAKIYVTRRVVVVAESEEQADECLRLGEYEQIDHDEFADGEDFWREAELLDVEEVSE